jgi:hypothetical protein
MPSLKKLFGSVKPEGPASTLAQPPSTDRQEKMDALSSLLPIIPGKGPEQVAINMDTAAKENIGFNTAQQVDNAVAPASESDGQAQVSPVPGESDGQVQVSPVPGESDSQAPAGQPPGESDGQVQVGQSPGESDTEKLPLSKGESDKSGIIIPMIKPSKDIEAEGWNRYICDRITYGVFNLLKLNPKNITTDIDLIIQIKHDLKFFKERIETLLKETKKIKGQDDNIEKAVQKVIVSIANYFKYMHRARETVCDKMTELVNVYDKRENKRIRTDIRYKMSLPPILDIVNQMMYSVKHITYKRDKEGKLDKVEADIDTLLNGEKSMTGLADKKGVIMKVSEALTLKTEYFIDKLFPTEHALKEIYTSLEAASYGESDAFFEIVQLKTDFLSVPRDDPSFKTFLELILCLYIRLEGKVPEVDLNKYGLDKFKSEEMKEGQEENYPSLLLELLDKFRI